MRQRQPHTRTCDVCPKMHSDSANLRTVRHRDPDMAEQFRVARICHTQACAEEAHRQGYLIAELDERS